MSELGKLSLGELWEKHGEVPHPALEPICCAVMAEIIERHRITTGHAILSRAQVRSVLGPLLGCFRDEKNAYSAGHSGFARAGWDEAVDACARALLNLAPTDPSPLED